MNKHVKILVDSLLTEDQLYEQTKGIIEEALSSMWPDDTKFTIFLSAGDFRKLHGFQGSHYIMRHLIAAYVGRLTRFYCLEHPSVIPKVYEVMKKVEPAEERAMERLVDYFTKKLGPVSEERIKELDDIAAVWELQANQQIKELYESGETVDNQKAS